MARMHRLSLAGIPQHILQRGNNHLPSFFSSDDYELYLDYLDDAAEKYDVKVHAYCLMPNHVHLLMMPNSTNGISRVLQDLGRRYVRNINYRYGRTGTLWEGRYHSCLVERGNRLLDCYRYIETNPVRTGIVNKPEDYKWSSYCHNAFGEPNAIIFPHSEYLKLGLTEQWRRFAYKKLFNTEIDVGVIREIREATQSNRVLGDDQFLQEIEAELSICISKKKPGRPKKITAFTV